MASITSANLVLMLSVDNIYSNPVQLYDFAVDDIFDVPVSQIAEAQMGVDGYLTGGIVFTPTPMTIRFAGDSPSNTVIDQWWNQQLIAKDIFYGNGSATFPSLGKKFALVKGILTNWQIIPAARRTIQPRAATITWQTVQPGPTNILPNN
jgi:hypothetical protein